MKTSVSQKTGEVNYNFKIHAGPPVSDKCPECAQSLHVSQRRDRSSEPGTEICSQLAGPMWAGSLHDKEFVGKVLDHIEANSDKYGTSARMKGMMTVAKEVRFQSDSCVAHY